MQTAAQDHVPERLLFAITPKWADFRAAGEVIANNPLFLTKHTFPPIEFDHDIIRPKRVMHKRVVMVEHGAE